MPCSSGLLLCLISASAAVLSAATPQSRFVKKIDADKTDKEWLEGDIDDEEWHEDTFEWKRKLQAKHPGMSIDDLIASMKSGKKDAYLQNEAQKKDMQMAFVSLNDGATEDKRATELLGSKWQSILLSGGNKVNFYATADHELLVTEEYGRILEVRDFLLAQPEVSKVRWKDTDFTKESVAAASGGSAAAPKPKKSGKKKSKTATTATPASASKSGEL